MDILKTLQKSRPDKHKDRVAWNASWELELKLQYEGMEGFVTKAPIVNSTAKTPQISPQALLNEERTKIHICELEEDLVKMALERMNSDDFEAKWKGLPQKRREELVLEGLYQACSTGPDMERFRRWCPDITVENLAGNSGQGYIDMLKMLFHQDGSVQVTEPTIIHHAGLDRYFTKSQGFVPPEISKYRAFFMDLTMWRILLAFYGGKEDWIIYKGIREGSDSKAREKTQAVLKGIAGDSWEKEFRKMKREYKNDKLKFGAVTVCWACRKDASKLDPDQELKVCSRCKSIGRSIFYCSSKCQKHDWKHGNPPHKSICGTEENIKSEEPKPRKVEHDGMIPSPDPGFRRSAALLHQISLLRRKQGVDYVLINPAPLDDVGVAERPGADRQKFLVMRYRAFKNGDRKAIRFMYQSLKFTALSENISKHYPVFRLKEQFEREYGAFDLDTIDMHFEEPSEDELAMVKELMS